jgi:hypothetical protein
LKKLHPLKQPLRDHTYKQKQFSIMKTNAQKQVAAFDQVLGHCNALGPMYNPSKESLKVTALTSVLTSAQVSIQAADTAKANLILATNARQKVFAPLPAIGTRILNGLVASDAPPQLIADIKLYRDKFRSARSGKVTAKPEDSTTPSQPASTSRRPVSYLDFESKITNFGMMIEMLKSEASYTPHESEMSIAGLTTLLATLRETNKTVRDARVALKNAILLRRNAVYSDAGIYGVAKRVKKYILFAYGATSDQFLLFSSISIKAR